MKGTAVMKKVRVRNLVLGDGNPKICVPLIAHTYSELENALAEVSGCGYDLVEFRSDFYFEEEAPALDLIRRTVLDHPLLYTLRTKEEGGEIEISDDAYRERILMASDMADMADVQLSRLHTHTGNRQLHSDLIDRLHAVGTKVVLSWHDFDRTPKCEAMVEMMQAMQEEGGDISKIAVMPATRMDVCELIRASVVMLEEKADRPFITMSMGSLGRVTRYACAFTGSCITFGMAGASSAPGQIPADRLRSLFALSGDT